MTTISLMGALGFGWFAVLSLREKARRAALVSMGLAGVFIGLFFTTYFALIYKSVILFIIIGSTALAAFLFFLPIGKLLADKHTPTKRVDERTIMFARDRLKPGTPEYNQYYTLHPEHKAVDDRTRARPGLLSRTSRHANPLAFAASEASFQLTEMMHPMVEGEPAPSPYPFTPQQATEYVKSLAVLYGAVDVGITPLKPYHVYSHVGRGPGEYGSPIQLDHRYAVAFTVEMDNHQMSHAPQAPVVMESARQYVEAGKIAVQLAAVLRSLGYPARAHMDANYRVICPPIARDAGLGEIGRMGLLMTPKLGPRVRIGVVTTDLELIPDAPQPSPAMIDFCMVCRKCATSCPSHSIPFGPRKDEDGITRWNINQETCFAYWNEIGTDCGVCMSVCPYAHPDNTLHNLVRWGNARSGAFRRMAVWMDDLFYGKNPARVPVPDWIQEQKE
ncbi:MAG: 4Fe-4S dicluster domain-containing protein [Anaerolineales bacterium]